MVESKRAICTMCDLHCMIQGQVENGKLLKLGGMPEHPIAPNTFCIKPTRALEYYDHETRLLHPLKRKGERGSGEFTQITWDQAYDEIAQKLTDVVKQYGPEAFTVSYAPYNAFDNGTCRRFMNLLGSPNWISGISLCMGNTAVINRMTYGWYPSSDYENTNCVVYFGHNPKPNVWAMENDRLIAAQKRGAKLIVLDPSESYNAKRADIHLPLRAGTDAAMALGWLKVIIDENLYDKDFVDNWTVGFDDLVQRLNEYPLDKVEKITGVPAERIREAAIMYATAKSACIPWSVITDKQKNSTSAIRAQCILRAITGNLNASGGDRLSTLNPDIVSMSEIELHEMLPQEKKDLQIGTDNYPALTYKGTQALGEPSKKVHGREYINLMGGSFMAHPAGVFKAMRTSDPYPIKAMASIANNTLMQYANQKGIYDGIMNLDLFVVHEHFMTPTAQLADYVLPGDAWIERPNFVNGFDSGSTFMVGQKLRQAPGECRSVYDFWRGLGIRMGFEEYFPWKDEEELLDYRIQKTGMKWNEFAEKVPFFPGRPPKPYQETGFATPSGKVELSSSVLSDLGYDPLPHYIEPGQSPIATPELVKEYPLTLYVGLMEEEYFHSSLRQIDAFRKRNPFPISMINPETGRNLGISEGDWVFVETTHGRIKMKAGLRDEMPPDLVRVPHGWWFPEQTQGEPTLSAGFDHSDAVVLSDDDYNLDPEQGLPDMRGGVLCKVYPV
ncbi:MAG: molybdopterin-dependent oxidoreductase [Deltaproteobacteria bacterium]|nr:molybdopterin-dependent oxidoreductase [Deltaproteobacteria bacterium]MBW2084557.1 molybdopterin-dependent oxidoreductase [Deltaproteobacteria bacterium]